MDISVEGESVPVDRGNTPFAQLGGIERVQQLVERFFTHLDVAGKFPAARAQYPDDLTGPQQRLFEFLCGWLGGPQLYVQKYGHPRLRARHTPFSIGEAERDEWLQCMACAMDDCEITGPVREFLNERFAHVADFMRNRG